MSEGTAAVAATSTPAATPSAPATEAATSATTESKATSSVKEAASGAATLAPSKPELHEVKVDGKVVKMTLEELRQHASMGHAADRRFKEAAQMRKEAENVIGKIRNPEQMMEALMDPALGLTKDQIREKFEDWYAREFIEPEKLTPEQRKLREYEAKIKKYADEEKAREQEKIKNEQESMTTQAREAVQKQIIDALETSGLPKTNFTIRRLAYWMQRNMANGYDAPTEVIVGQVRNEMNGSLRELVEASDGEVLLKVLGDSVVQKIRKHDLEQLRKTRAQPTQTPDGMTPTPPKTERPLTSHEVNQRIRQMQKTGRY